MYVKVISETEIEVYTDLDISSAQVYKPTAWKLIGPGRHHYLHLNGNGDLQLKRRFTGTMDLFGMTCQKCKEPIKFTGSRNQLSFGIECKCSTGVLRLKEV